MKVAVTSSGEGLDAPMDERLGRCPYFVILDTETGEIESLFNSAAEASSGAGTKAMQLLLDKNVQAIITGKIGPNAAALIEEAEMEALTERKGTVRQVLDAFRRDRGL